MTQNTVRLFPTLAAAAVSLALCGPAAAQTSCSEQTIPLIDVGTNVPNLTPEQVFAINQTLAAFAFSLNFPIEPEVPLDSILTDNFRYEVCRGNIQVELHQSRQEYSEYMTDIIFAVLLQKNLATRHYFANTVLSEDSSGVITATVSMLTILEPEYLEAPILDYGSTLRITLSKDTGGFAIGGVVHHLRPIAVGLGRAR